MDISKSFLRLQWAAPGEPWATMRQLLRAASSDKSLELRADPLSIDRAAERKRITLQVRALTVEHERLGDSVDFASATGHLQAVVAEMYEAVPFPPVTEMSCTLQVIQPVETPFHEVAARMKATFLAAAAPFGADATDVAFVFDTKGAELLTHVQIGPMDQAQLRAQYLRWPPEVIPETFMFLELGFTEPQRESTFTTALLREFAQRAHAWQESTARQIVDSLE